MHLTISKLCETTHYLFSSRVTQYFSLLKFDRQGNPRGDLKNCSDFPDSTALQVVAGLKKFVKVEELEGRKVCVILNLKPAKLAGQVSEAMILAGSIATPEGSEIVKVRLTLLQTLFLDIHG